MVADHRRWNPRSQIARHLIRVELDVQNHVNNLIKSKQKEVEEYGNSVKYSLTPSTIRVLKPSRYVHERVIHNIASNY